jgi:hypothetical protein
MNMFFLGMIAGILLASVILLIEIRLSVNGRTMTGEAKRLAEKRFFGESGEIYGLAPSREEVAEKVINALK